ncbi:ATP-binding protein [Hazenella coriacea]|uniref:AAA domain-containing protein n=1 Tax=Hazenella coriacea TaxID=1179467 RepID=A0A4R3LBQ2_9BACL|nr:SbcC/MukB-like Walker B domain-containing protein [Hazenella coriacea]TCS95734.1 AAA domain-containing protein [Hazenella coriacea]
MKWLKKLKLINWHYFQEETLEFGRQTLISGRNAAGKSTIIDALQVLLISDRRKIRFNPAAHENAKRTLLTYLRGKKGTDEQTFVREGEFTSYIVAEFRDERKREPFVIGLVIDVYHDDQYEEEFFMIPNVDIKSIEFTNSSMKLRNREEFRRYCTNMSSKVKFERNKESYQKMLLNRMGQVHDRFSSVLTKALSFKPIHNIREFVYDYILDKRELQLNLLKQNFDIYQQYQRELNDLQERQQLLGEIQEKYEQYAKLRETVTIQDYIVRRSKHKEQVETKEQLESDIDSFQKNLISTESEISLTEQQQVEVDSQVVKAYQKWQSHEIKARQEELKKQIHILKQEIEQKRKTYETLREQLLNEWRLINELIKLKDGDYWKWEGDDQSQLSHASKILCKLLEESYNIEVNLDLVKSEFVGIGEYLSSLNTRITKAIGQVEDELGKLSERKNGLNVQIYDLENKKRPYPESIQRLKTLLEKRLAGKSPVWIFCEEMELIDEHWRNAIEGYLNRQRFDLLVKPEVFTEALSIYEQEKWKHHLEGIGLVDTDKEQKYQNTAKPSSLAEELETNNPIIQARIEHLLGQVMKVQSEKELRQHHTSITSTCMSYKNLVAKQIRKKDYETPFIGSQAIVRQLEMKRIELAEIDKRISQLKKKYHLLSRWQDRLEEKKSYYHKIVDYLALPVEIPRIEKELDQKTEELERLDMSEVDQFKDEYYKWKEHQDELKKHCDDLKKNRTVCEVELNGKKEELHKNQPYLLQMEEFINDWKYKYSHLLSKAEERWKQVEMEDTSTATKITNWTGSHSRYSTQREGRLKELTQLRHVYNLRYTHDGVIEAEDNSGYESLLEKIKLVDIPKYQKSLSEALRQTEEEFQSHFIYKLREAIELAKREFTELNYALKNFPFHQDQYQFKVGASEKYKKFYDVIMDPQTIERGSLFDLPDDDKVDTLNELFEKLIHGEVGDQEEFTDYRRYLDFDIIVISHGERTSFSKVLREKSGGETQTPFYIAILASFNHLYSDRTMRLVIFDEAFNKMDEERIQQTLRLIKQMNLQLIAAVPDEKMAHMAPEVSTTIVVHRQEFTCFVDILGYLESIDGIGDIGEGEHEEEYISVQNSLFAAE